MKVEMHGGNLHKASKEYGIKQSQLLDFSANINPLGPLVGLKNLLITSVDDIINYPDPEYSELRLGISKYLGVDENLIIPGNGASEIIYLLFEVLKPKKVLMPVPVFSEYERAVELLSDKYGQRICDIVYFGLKEEQSFNLELDEILRAMVPGIDAVVLCNPNNPTSTLIPKVDLITIVQQAENNGTMVIIDETFIEMTVDGNKNSLVNRLENHKNLFIIRAFTKVLAMPGLRLGYGLGCGDILNQMWTKKLPWSVNSMAAAIGKILPAVVGYIDETSKWLAEEKEWLFNKLVELPGLRVYKPNTNFILLKLLKTHYTAGNLKNLMGREGILIRDASNFRGLDNSFFRVAVKDRQSNIRLLNTLKKVLG